MKFNFRLPDFPNSNFTLEKSIWIGKTKLFKDNIQIEQLSEKGKPFLIPKSDGSYLKAFTKQSFPDFVPTIEINGKKSYIVDKLKWYEYALGGFPILLLFIGGALGGIIGVMGVILNFSIFRQEGSQFLKYLKVVGIVLASYLLYFIIAALFLNWMN